MKNFLNRVTNALHRLARDPARSSRAVFSGILVLGMMALTLDIGPRAMPQYFGARLLDPLDKETWDEIVKLRSEDQEAKNRVTLTNTCLSDRKIGKDSDGQETDPNYKEFLDNFEYSFSGIMPGVGNLLTEYPSLVSDRREKLVFEVMQHYAELKFCITSSQFKPLYLANYKNLIGKLNTYMQVRLNEDNAKDNPISEEKINSTFLPDFAEEFIWAEKDLISTQEYVEDVIDRAIESAIELDKATALKVANLTSKTANTIAAYQYNVLDEILGTQNLHSQAFNIVTKNQVYQIDQLNQLLGYSQANIWTSAIGASTALEASLEDVSSNTVSDLLTALEEKLPDPNYVNKGGTSTSDDNGDEDSESPADDSEVSSGYEVFGGAELSVVAPELTGLSELLSEYNDKTKTHITHGLLNLVDGEVGGQNIRKKFLNNYYVYDALAYMGARLSIDPYVPGQSGITATVSYHSDEMCDLDGANYTTVSCFGFNFKVNL